MLFSSGAGAQTSVKVGVLSDMSGSLADLGGPGAVVAAQMAIEDFKPESRGLKVELVSADHQNKADIGAAIARRWYDVDKVDMITELSNSAVALAVSETGRQLNKSVIVAGAGASDLTGSKCTPTTIHWTYDTWAVAHAIGSAVVDQGGKSWFFMTADYSFGYALERDATEVIKEKGGKIIGSVKNPINTPDFSSFVLQAQASRAQVVGLASAGTDTINAIKQAAEFGLVEGGQRLAGLLVFISDVHALGLQDAQGLTIAEAFYWDRTPGSRAWSKRFAERNKGRFPTMIQAGVYSSVYHYLATVASGAPAGDGEKITTAMKGKEFKDELFGVTTVRADGRAIHPLYLFEVKKPSESKEPYDYYKTLAIIPADEAFRPMNKGGCALVK